MPQIKIVEVVEVDRYDDDPYLEKAYYSGEWEDVSKEEVKELEKSLTVVNQRHHCFGRRYLMLHADDFQSMKTKILDEARKFEEEDKKMEKRLKQAEKRRERDRLAQERKTLEKLKKKFGE